MVMRKVIIFLGILLAFSVTQAQVGPTDSLNRGITRVGKVRNGCDCEKGQKFDTRRGQDTLVPRVTRTGKRLAVKAFAKDSIPGCGTTDEEALVDITVTWTGNYISKITHCGVKYRKSPDHGSGEDCDQDNEWKVIDSTVALCGDFTIRLMLEMLCPGSTYQIFAYVVTIGGDTAKAEERILTKKRNRCGGWKYNDRCEESINGSDSIILVKDIENNWYGVVQIGDQCWLRENMRCKQSPHGHILEADSVGYSETRGIYYQVSDDIPYRYRYDALNLSYRQRGNLYNWPAVVDTSDLVTELPPGVRRGICPEGWHVPNIYEWYKMISASLTDVPDLEVYLNDDIPCPYGGHEGMFCGDSVVRMSFGCDWPMSHFNDFPGGYMDDPSHRNSSGFAALPANNVQPDGSLGYTNHGEFINVANFWLATPEKGSATQSYSWHIDDNRRGVSTFARPRKRGFSVRCIRDQLTIAVNPSNGKFCVPSTVTYTPKVAMENTGDYKFYWSVIPKNGTADATPIIENVEANPFVFAHTEEGIQKIICHAVKTVPIYTDDPTADLEDSIFVAGADKCTIIKANPSLSSVCIGETVTFTAEVPGVNLAEDYLLSWKMNGNDLDDPSLSDLNIIMGIKDTSFTCTFPTTLTKDSTFTISVQLTPVSGGDCTLDICEDIRTMTVSTKMPSLTVCSDCDAQGFVIKKAQITYSNTVAPNSVIWRDKDHNAISYKRKENDTVKISVYNGPYSIEMTSTAGCRYTMPNVVLKPTKIGCKVEGIKQHDTVEQGPTADSIYYVLDHEHNRYSTMQIGLNRCWMKENLRTTTSPSDPSLYIVGSKDMEVDLPYTSRLACWYKNDSTANSHYGLLYNWCAAADTTNDESADPWNCSLPVNHRGICPTGWHLPTNQEWTELETYLNGDEYSTFSADTIAGMLSGSCDWKVSTIHHTPGNYHDSLWAASGFTVLPAGQFAISEGSTKMEGLGTSAKFWTASQGNANSHAVYHGLDYNKPMVTRSDLDKSMGLSVRCVRDIPQMAIDRRALDNCTYQMFASFSSSDANAYYYEWKINNNLQSSHTSEMEFAFEETVTQYHIVCHAMVPGTTDPAFKDSTDITLNNWPPSISTCIDDVFGSIKVMDAPNVASAVWLDSNDQEISTVIKGYVSTEPLNGRYAVRMYNKKQLACLSDTVTVEVRPATYCIVSAKNSNIEIGPSDNPDRIDSLLDNDGNAYPVVQIGSRCWTKENMRTATGVRSNNPANSCTNGTLNNNLPRYYDNCATTMTLKQRGYLYNWNAANLVCPPGWKLPNAQEWADMANTVMDNQNKTCMLAGSCEWTANSTSNAAGNYSAPDRNISGFTIVPAGTSGNDGKFAYMYTGANFWTSDRGSSNGKAKRVVFDNNRPYMTTNEKETEIGLSVRCMRDIPNLANQCYKSNNSNEILNSENPSLIDSVQNIEGKWNYGVVQIGGLCWLRENLRDTVGLTDAMVTTVKGTVDSTVAYYYHYDTLNTPHAPYIPLKESGLLYNWKAAKQAICPAGWHLPSRNEWLMLSDQAATTDMLAGTDYWVLGSNSATDGCPYYCNTTSFPENCNKLGFTLVPAGNMQVGVTYQEDGTLDYAYRAANFWTSDANPSTQNTAYYTVFDSHQNYMRNDYRPTERGFSVRCVRNY